jgi:poly-gamma-glutamate capsule biosynthesis protein CapA/YwtB (metallophosphatase superfamily)
VFFFLVHLVMRRLLRVLAGNSAVAALEVENAVLRHQPGMETFRGEQRGDPLRFSHAVVDAGADLVLGSGPHVLRGMEWYRGRLIAYSLGNFTGHHTLNTSGAEGVSAVLRIRLRANGSFIRGRVVPIRLVGAGTPMPDRTREAFTLLTGLSRSDFAAHAARLSASGLLRPPARRH